MSFFGLGQSADIDVVLADQETRKSAEIKSEDGKKKRHFLFYDGESVSGKVNITLRKSGTKLEHQGIKIEFVGQIELYYDRGNHHEFTSLVKELARPGILTQSTSYDFEFVNVEKPYESYTGTNVRLRYFLRVTVVKRLSDQVEELELITHTLSVFPEMNNSIKMEVGIEDCLHIEFEYNKSKYHLKDVIVGKIYFLLVRIKIKHMELAIIKRETTGSGPNTFNENETIAKYEIMDGAPVRGETIPIRLFLSGYDMTPTMRDVNKKFSVRYYLNLVLVDEEERRYFKQQEIILWRKGEKKSRVIQSPSATMMTAVDPPPLQNNPVTPVATTATSPVGDGAVPQTNGTTTAASASSSSSSLPQMLKPNPEDAVEGDVIDSAVKEPPQTTLINSSDAAPPPPSGVNGAVTPSEAPSPEALPAS